ncbi:hypothetical protein AAFF27_09150 [Xylophilus sp. GW821-FHT01B05]
MRRAPSPQLLVSALLMLVLAFAALAGSGCKRPSGQPPTAIVLPALSMAAAEQADELFVFEHPELSTADLNAVAAQVALDTQVSNDDRTEMIEWAPTARATLVASHGQPPAAPQGYPRPSLQDLLRPPRA